MLCLPDGPYMAEAVFLALDIGIDTTQSQTHQNFCIVRRLDCTPNH